MNLTNEAAKVDKFIFIDERLFVLISYAIGYILQFLSNVVGNCLELYILLRIKQPEDYITFALCTLACSDLIQAFITMPTNFSIIIYYDWFLGDFLCKFSNFIKFANRLTGIWITVYIAFDRYINVCHPFRFGGLKNKKVCILALCCICLGNALIFLYIFPTIIIRYTICLSKDKFCQVCLFHLSFPSILIQRILINMLYTFFLPIILLLFFNFSILKTLLNVISFNAILMTPTSVYETPRAHHLINLVIIKVVIGLVIIFFITNFPIFLMSTIEVLEVFIVGNSELNTVGGDGKLSMNRKFAKISFFLYTINSSLNPWIYSFYSKNFRKEVRKRFSSRKRSTLRFSVRKPSQIVHSLSLYINQEEELD